MNNELLTLLANKFGSVSSLNEITKEFGAQYETKGDNILGTISSCTDGGPSLFKQNVLIKNLKKRDKK